MLYSQRTRKLFNEYWGRFDRYEIRDDRIRPVKGAAWHSYNPWDEYRAPEGKQSIRQPYHSLLDIVNGTGPASLKSAIEEWCGKNGLLGVLLHSCESISQNTIRDGLPCALTYAREAESWRETPVFGAPAAGALIRGLGQFSTQLRTPQDTWGQFLPEISGIYPCPFSEEFWRAYTEPVTVFLDAARLLSTAVAGLRTLRESKGQAEIKRFRLRQSAGPAIGSLLLPVRPIIEMETRTRYRLGYSTGSLLADLAMMALLDVTSYRLIACGNETCGALLVTRSTTAHYCSARCRGTAQMRKYRARKEAK